MKLPWDKNYLKITLHGILLVGAAYILIRLIDSATYILTNLGGILSSISGFFNGLFSVFSVVVIAFVIAYLFDPAVDFFQRHYASVMEKHCRPFVRKQLEKIPLYRKLADKPKEKEKSPSEKRTAGVLLVFLTVGLVLTGIVMFLVNRIGGGRLEGLVKVTSASVLDAVTQLSGWYASLQITLAEWGVGDYTADIVAGIVDALTAFLKTIPKSITDIATNAGGIIGTGMIAVVVSFYFMRDKKALLARTKVVAVTFLPARIERIISGVLHEVNEVFSGYVRGRLTDAMIMAVLLSIGLSIVGVPFAVPIGIFAGLSNIVPYFGGIVAFVVSMMASLVAGEPARALWAALVVLGLQQVDSMFIEPRVVGQKVELSPMLVMISLAVGGNLFGVSGMLFAVPVCAVLKIFVSRYINRAVRMKKLSEPMAVSEDAAEAESEPGPEDAPTE